MAPFDPASTWRSLTSDTAPYEHRLDSVVAEAGFLGPQPPTPAAGARLVRLAFGISLVPGPLEARLPAGELSG